LTARKSKELLGLKEAGELIGWDIRKMSVYYSRGKLPVPYALVGGRRPAWKKEQIENWLIQQQEEG